MMAGLETIGSFLFTGGFVVFIIVVVLFVVAIASIKASQNTGSDSHDRDKSDKHPDKEGSCSSNSHT